MHGKINLHTSNDQMVANNIHPEMVKYLAFATAYETRDINIR
jgi:hypothetical protein